MLTIPNWTYSTVAKALKHPIKIEPDVKLEPGQNVDVVEAFSDRPTVLSALVLSGPELLQLPIWGSDYFCQVEVEGITSWCRVTFSE